MTAPKKMSLSEALVQALRTCQKCGAITEKATCSCKTKLRARPVKEVIDGALKVWSSPAGKTPRATASAQLLYLVRKGLAEKPERGMVIVKF